MFVVTGGAGFIGSALVFKLNQEGVEDILIVDELGSDNKWKNLNGLKFSDYIHKESFLQQLRRDSLPVVDAILHMGACSSTTEQDSDYLMENNFAYSKHLAEFAMGHNSRFIYASSAATYGDGSQGYSDQHDLITKLRPLNMYGYSKQLFDLWVLRNGYDKSLVGLKFFNVFGPHEYHKGSMGSMILKAYQQVKNSGCVKLFRSNTTDYKDGEQKRDFIYIKDCFEPIWWLLNNSDVSGIFNLGSGKARTWLDLANAVFSAMKREAKIEFVDMPAEIKSQYQNFTEADMSKLQATGCPLSFHALEESVSDYVNNYLESDTLFLQ